MHTKHPSKTELPEHILPMSLGLKLGCKKKLWNSNCFKILVHFIVPLERNLTFHHAKTLRNYKAHNGHRASQYRVQYVFTNQYSAE